MSRNQRTDDKPRGRHAKEEEKTKKISNKKNIENRDINPKQNKSETKA